MPSVFERSVIDMGQGSYIIALPKPWLRYHNLKPGDQVQIITNGELKIRPLKQRGALPRGGIEKKSGDGQSQATSIV